MGGSDDLKKKKKEEDKAKRKRFGERNALTFHQQLFLKSACLSSKMLFLYKILVADIKPPSRVGKKRRHKGASASSKMPKVFPTTKCKLRMLKLNRVKDYLLMEEEFIRNQDALNPKEKTDKED